MIDLDTARKILKGLVAERPDYVYEQIESNTGNDLGCFYWNSGAPSCGVGHVLHRAGVPDTAIAWLDTRESGAVYKVPGTNASDLHEVLPEHVTPEAARYFSVFQLEQDAGATWAQALEAAEAHVEVRL
jgi:hypothetical protein